MHTRKEDFVFVIHPSDENRGARKGKTLMWKGEKLKKNMAIEVSSTCDKDTVSFTSVFASGFLNVSLKIQKSPVGNVVLFSKKLFLYICMYTRKKENGFYLRKY